MSNFSEKKILDNKYEILGLIGTGGMAYVYKARNIHTGEFVAIKVLKREYCDKEEYIKKFDNEARAVKPLKHPNIVQIYEVGNIGSVHYITREYVNGITLEDYIKKHPTVSWQKCFEITRQILQATACAHSKHVIHRDIKPMNILICEDGTVKLSDFGIAKAVTGATIENTKNSVGSIHYVSPEHARGGFVDERSDIYSIGVTMYEMVVGAVPFDGDTQVEIALKHLSGKFVQPHDVDPEIPMGVNDIIVQALMKDPGLRFQSAMDMLTKMDMVEKDPGVPFLPHEDLNENGIDDVTEKVVGEDIDVKKLDDSDIQGVLDEMEKTEAVEKGATKPLSETKPIGEAIQEAKKAVPPVVPETPVKESDDIDVVIKHEEEETEEQKAKREKKEKHRKVRETVFRALTYVFAVAAAVAAAIFLVSTMKTTADRIYLLSKATYTVENYTGYEAVSVIEMLKKENIEVKQELIVDENYLGAGYIVSQDIAPGKTIRKGDVISFKVSSQEGSFIVTDCTEMKEEDAIDEMEKLGLKHEIVRVRTNNIEKGIVYKMIPDGGSVVMPDDTIKLYVSDGELFREVEVPNLKGMTLTEAKKALEAVGLSQGFTYPKPGQDITYILYPTEAPSPSPSPTPEVSEEPSTEPSPEVTPGNTDEPIKTAEPAPTAVTTSLKVLRLEDRKPVYASNTVQYQYPPAGTILYENESVDFYFYDISITSDNMLREYKNFPFASPTDDETGSVTFAVTSVPNDTGKKISLYNKTVYMNVFPITVGIPKAYNGGGTDVSVYADSKLLYKYLCK